MVGNPEYEACSDYTSEGDGCWKPAVEQRWLDEQPRCWIHLGKILIDHMDDVRAWERTFQMTRSVKLRVVKPTSGGRR